ncbi:MAG: ABC transporter ATP-binding protein [Alphaproteobacteria bacterium]|nr:ABC transporter ATP-binding protein [Alphaproteobacteria bacterium]
MSADVELDRVTIRFGSFTAVRDASLKIAGGEFFSLLGPSGCGKTTLLRTISGFLDPSEGSVRIGGEDMRGIEPNRRPTALIFQNLALFPLMTVADNIAYGLRVRGVPRAQRMARAAELLSLVALPDQGHKRVSELSGGQKQRVAIARALAVEPKVLLLDEPLSALDLKLRQHMRNELRAIQKRVGITFIYITHDQGEALTMSDRIAVMNHGVVEQVGTGREIYADPRTPFVASFFIYITHDQGEALTMSDRIAVMNHGVVEQVGTGREIYADPRTPFVASFVGENNGIEGRIASVDGARAAIDTPLGRLVGRRGEGAAAGRAGTIFVRPESLRVAAPGTDAALAAEIVSTAFEGSTTHVFLRAASGQALTMTVDMREAATLPAPGATLRLSCDEGEAIVLATDGKGA